MPKPARGGTAVEALVGQATVINPLFETNESGRDVDSLIYQGLTTVDAQQNVVGVLAQDWTLSPDHLTYTFTVREGVKWADGQPFGADDVLFTYHVLQDLEYSQPGGDIWRQVGIRAGKPGQVVFSLQAPDAAFPSTLRIGIIAKHIFAGMAPEQIANSPYSAVRAFGTGPFKVGSINNLAISLDRNPNAVPQPYLDHFVLRTYPATDPQQAIRAVLSGAADLVGGIQPQEVDTLSAQQNLSVKEVRMFTNSFVSFDAEGDGKQFFSDPKVRLALVQAIDRHRIVTEVLAGRADVDPNPIPTADWAYSAAAANLHPYDSVAASRALDDAGWVLDPTTKLRAKKNVSFKVSMVVSDLYPSKQIADAIASQLLAVGVEVDVKPMPVSRLMSDDVLTHRYQMALVLVDEGSDPDLYDLWHSTPTAGGLNFSYSRGWGLIDKDLEDGRAAIDPQSRLGAYLDFQVLMADAAPAIFVYAGRYEYAVSNRVHGVHMNGAIEPYDRFQYVTDWYVNITG